MTDNENSNLKARINIGVALYALNSVESNIISEKEFNRIVDKLRDWHIALVDKEINEG